MMVTRNGNMGLEGSHDNECDVCYDDSDDYYDDNDAVAHPPSSCPIKTLIAIAQQLAAAMCR